MKKFIEPIRDFYGRFERPISSISLVAGFVFDAVTLRRVDEFWENLWTIGHLAIVATFIALIHIHEKKPGSEHDPSQAHFWYVNILQFFFGGILSTYLVFYFRSADIFVAWPFMLVLAIAFILNESLKKHYVRLSFQISLFFLSVYSFAIFLVPVILHRIGTMIFLLSGLLSLLFITAFISFLFYFIKDRFSESRTLIISLILGIFAVVNILYITNLIPPIPLSLKDGGIYHSVQKEGGSYLVTEEDHNWQSYFNLYQNFTEVSGTPVYAFSAIFSPTGLNTTLLHEWQAYDESTRSWKTVSTIHLPVIGGRDNGFRTYSIKSDLAPGKWRVNIKTEDGLTVGRLRFNIIRSSTLPLLTLVVK